jgi:hypothetical protein
MKLSEKAIMKKLAQLYPGEHIVIQKSLKFYPHLAALNSNDPKLQPLMIDFQIYMDGAPFWRFGWSPEYSTLEDAVTGVLDTIYIQNMMDQIKEMELPK